MRLELESLRRQDRTQELLSEADGASLQGFNVTRAGLFQCSGSSRVKRNWRRQMLEAEARKGRAGAQISAHNVKGSKHRSQYLKGKEGKQFY